MFIKSKLVLIAVISLFIQSNIFAKAPLPSYFDYGQYLKWIQGHDYKDMPSLFGFNPGVSNQYQSTDVAVNVVCNQAKGCKNFVFWPFDVSEIGLLSYENKFNHLSGTQLSSVDARQLNLKSDVITKIYIPALDQSFIPSNDPSSPQIIGKNGLNDWIAFDQVNYNDTLMVVYLDIKKLQDSNVKILFQKIPSCSTNRMLAGQCPIDPKTQFFTSARPLKGDVELLNGTTWSLISRQGVGPSYNNDPVKLDYTYTVFNGLSSTKSFNLGLTLGGNVSANLILMNASVSRNLSRVWGQSVSVTESSTSSLSAHCTNVSSEHSKVCPIYELMATTAIYTPGLQEELDILNAAASKTPAVEWRIGETQQTADGKSIGITYPIGGVFLNGLSVTQSADYLIPLLQTDAVMLESERCEKKIKNESNQPWAVSGKEKRLGDPKYQFKNCAPFSPKDTCIILPKTTATYSGRFIVHQGFLTVEDMNKKSFVFSEKGSFGFSVCPYIHDVDDLSSSFKINEPTDGDLIITKDTLM